MLSFLAYLQQSPTETVSGELWEIMKGVFLTLSTLGVGYLVKATRQMELNVRLLQVAVYGEDGKNGLKGDSRETKKRLSAIEERNERIDAVTEYERSQYDGPERRRNLRRLRDKQFPGPLDEGADDENQ